MLSTLFAVKAELCNRKFELKVNDVRFVGHPTLLPYRTNKDDNAAMILINIVFALQASASHSIGKQLGCNMYDALMIATSLASLAISFQLLYIRNKFQFFFCFLCLFLILIIMMCQTTMPIT